MKHCTENLFLAASMVLLVGMCACVEGMRIGETHTDAQHIALGAAKSVSVDLKMASGTMKVRGGAGGVMDGTFIYNVPSWSPRVDYHVSGDVGQLTIEEPGETHTAMGGSKYSWDVQLNNEVPMDITVEMGAGQSNLSLAELALTRLRVEMGAGNSDVDLRGSWNHDVEVDLEGGVGNATIRLPRSMGVHVTVSGGLGSVQAADFRKEDDAYVNDEYGKSPSTINVRVQGGIGNVKLELGGGPTV
jgi:hypothetical protein